MIRNRVTRPAITLVEMMVAMALSIGIMLILTESFKMALDFVRGANATGSLILQLNGAGLVLSQDLKADHFLPEDNKPGRGLRLSDQRLDMWNPALGPWPMQGGFFAIRSQTTGVETTDANNFTVNLPASQHVLFFTSVLQGGTDQNLHSAVVNGVTYTSRAAEVAYFLAPTAQSTGGAASQQLYNLIRRYRLVAVNADEQAALQQAVSIDMALNPMTPTHQEVISVPAPGGQVNTLATLASNPANRMALAPIAITTTSGRYGEDIVVSNVLSFEVLADWTPNPSVAGSNQPPLSYAAGNTEAPYDFLSRNNVAGVFDTTNPPQYIRIKSLQITIRVFDTRMKYTRQNTWKFAM